MKTIILVHPCMSLELVFSVIKSEGYKIFSIITGFELTKINKNFIENASDYTFYGSVLAQEDQTKIDEIISTNQLTICGVINGLDSSVYYADFLAKKYIDPEIDLAYSKIRENKQAVNLCLTQNNLPSIRGFEMLTLNDLENIKGKLSDLKFPIVAKPSENTAAMSAFRVLNHSLEVDSYVNTFFMQENPYYRDNTIDKIVFQEYIDRLNYQEYVLDFVSYHGKHYCRSIIHYDKENVSGEYPISRFYRPMSLKDNPELSLLVDYVTQCLNALNVRNGFTHNEVFYDGQSEVLLVEINNRAAGGGLLELIDFSYESNPIRDYLSLTSHNTIPDMSIKDNTIAIDVYNTSSDMPNDFDFTDLTSEIQVLHFRNKKRHAHNYFEDYSRVDHVNACLFVSNPSSVMLENDSKTIVEREKLGRLFVSNT